MKHVLFQNKKIYYRDEGAGKPLVLVHGFAEDGRIWNLQVEKLKEKNRLLIPDLPGSGASEMLEGEVSIMDFAEVLKAITDAEIKNENSAFTIIGHSMGGYISLAFTEKYANQLNGLGLFHSSCFADDEQKKATRKKGIAFIDKNGAETFLKNTIPNLFSEMTKRESPELMTRLIDLSKYLKGRVLKQYYEAMMKRPDRTDVLKSFSKPVLFAQGLLDTAVPLQSGLQQAHIPSISFFHILKYSGHVGMWEEKKASTGLMEQFLGHL